MRLFLFGWPPSWQKVVYTPPILYHDTRSHLYRNAFAEAMGHWNSPKCSATGGPRTRVQLCVWHEPCPSFPWFFGIPWLILSKEIPWLFVFFLWFFQGFSGLALCHFDLLERGCRIRVGFGAC